MCGIVGYNGNRNNTLDILIEGLKTLEYRGYDSAGIAYKKEKKVNIIKSVGKIVNLESKLPSDNSNLGIAHTRWATHGKVSELNSHPHKVGNITIVHNGIIENYKELKQQLVENSYKFKSDTDTEVACALIDFYYKKYNNILEALKEFINTVKGAYALGIMVDNDDNLYSIRLDCPLVIGKDAKGNIIASDIIAINKYANKIYYLQPEQIAKLSKNEITIYDLDLKEINYTMQDMPNIDSDISKCGYEHYMLKEINEERLVFKNTIDKYLSIDSIVNIPSFSKYNRIDIVACGSAYHAGLVGKSLIEEYGKIIVNVEVASEYRYKNNFYDKKTLVIVVSQSGETADTLAALRKAKNDKIDTMAIVNVENSTIYREADYILMTQAGKEIAVATTKAYLSQITVLGLIALKLGIENNTISDKEYKEILKDINELPILIDNVINNYDYKKLAKKIYKRDDIFFIGRGIDYAMCMEGSLKLKEISYIPSQAYAAGELKHGTISLIKDKTIVIGIITDQNLKEKTISNLEEVKSRGADIILVANSDINNYTNIRIPNVSKIFQSVLTVIPLQLIAYEVAKERKCDIDKPKNLAKSVTVE